MVSAPSLEHAAEDLTVADVQRENHERLSKRHVVDEPHVAEPDRAQPPALDVFDVIHDESRRAQRAQRLVGGGRSRRAPDGTRAPSRRSAVFRRRFRELSARPSASRTVGQATMAVGRKKASAIPRTRRELLPVLLAEVGAIGRGNLQELEDDGQHARRSVRDGARPPAPSTAGLSDAVAIAVRVQVVLRAARARSQRLRLSQHRQVVVQRSRVLRVVGRVVELGRVDEDADQRAIVLGPAPPHQRQMALVQRAHRRHEAERQPGALLRTPLRPPRRQALGRPSVTSSSPPARETACP